MKVEKDNIENPRVTIVETPLAAASENELLPPKTFAWRKIQYSQIQHLQYPG